MKKLVFCFLVLSASLMAKAQLNPITWAFSAKKIADKAFEIHMTATIQDGWHLYSQNQPEDAIAIPTEFTLNNNPMLIVQGKIKELGSMQKFHDAKLDLSANQYSHTVDFVQMVKLKAKVKTNLSGTVEFQTCDDHKCLPPKKVNFSVALN